MKKLVFIISSLIVFFFVESMPAQKSTKDIVETAASVDDFSTLVTALKAANLVGALHGEGPFTVFAPTNDAFAKLGSNTLNSLLKPENKKKLTSILTYHVVPGQLAATDVVGALKAGNGMTKVTTLNGETLKVVQKDDKIWLKDQNGNYSEIIKTDVMTSNGVIHIIDTVVMPKSKSKSGCSSSHS